MDVNKRLQSEHSFIRLSRKPGVQNGEKAFQFTREELLSEVCSTGGGKYMEVFSRRVVSANSPLLYLSIIVLPPVLRILD